MEFFTNYLEEQEESSEEKSFYEQNFEERFEERLETGFRLLEGGNIDEPREYII